MTEIITKSDGSHSAGDGTSSIRRMRVLLVEGDGFTRLVLLLRLRLAGFAVDFTSNGTLGLRKLLSFRPDVLLLDLKLYGLSGLELIKAARSEPTFRNRPIYVYARIDHLKRATSKEVTRLTTQVFDRKTVSREQVVQSLVAKFNVRPVPEHTLDATQPVVAVETSGEAVPPEVLEEIIAGVRQQAELLARSKEAGVRKATAQELLSRVCSLADCAEAANLADLNRQTKALQAFLREFCHKQQKDLKSALNTIARAVLVMSRMSPSNQGVEGTPEKYRIVAVDEAPLSRRALEQAVTNAGCEPVIFEEPVQARKYLSSTTADLIIINLRGPDAHGLSLREIRKLPLHSRTPVFYVPESSSPKPRGADLLTSAQRLDRDPSLLSELILMGLNELQNVNQAAAPTSAEPSKPPKAPKPVVAAPMADSTKAVNQFDDGFAMFAPPPGNRQVSPLHPPPSAIQQQPLSGDQTLGWSANHLPLPHSDAPSNLPMAQPPVRLDESDSQLIAAFRIASDLPAPEPALESPVETAAPAPINLVVTPLDEHQAEEVHLEQVAPVDLPGQSPELVSSESSNDSRAWQTPLGLEPATEGAPADIISSLAPHLEPTQPIVTEESNTANEVMNYPVASVSPDYLPQAGGIGESQRDAEARCAELEQQLAALRQAFSEYNNGLEDQQQAASEAARQVQELEERLQQATAELEFQREQQRSAHAESRRELEDTRHFAREKESAFAAAQARCAELERELNGVFKEKQALAEENDAARGAAQARCAELERALANARNEKQALAEKLVQEQKAAEARSQSQLAALQSGDGAPLSEQEQQLRQAVAALARATADLAKERGERQRSDQRAAELNRRMQSLHDDLRKAMQVQHDDLARVTALEEQHKQTSQALEQRTSDFEQEKAERQLATEQLQKVKDSNAQLHKDLAFLEETNKKLTGSRQELQSRLEASLALAKDSEARLLQETAERKHLSQTLENLQRELTDQSHKLELVQHELQTTREALQERDAKLQQQAAERQRLSDALDSVQRNAHQGPERDLELSKLESALQNEQVERKRQETQLARMRNTARNASHAAKELRTNLRRQIREPVDNVVHSTQSLLEMELAEPQKALAEAVLQDVLLVQARLREPEVTPSEAAESTGS